MHNFFVKKVEKNTQKLDISPVIPGGFDNYSYMVYLTSAFRIIENYYVAKMKGRGKVRGNISGAMSMPRHQFQWVKEYAFQIGNHASVEPVI